MGLFLISRIYNAIPNKSQNRTIVNTEKTKIKSNKSRILGTPRIIHCTFETSFIS